MESGGSSLSSFVLSQKELLLARIKPEVAVEALADAFIQELHKEVPGPNQHPNATGNLLEALTTRSAVTVTGKIWWVGVGDMARIGLPGEKKYKPKPIRRFLDWYLEREEGKYDERRQRQATAAADRAARARQREEMRKQRIVIGRREEQALWRRIATRKANARLNAMYRELDRLEATFARLATTIQNYSIYFERAGEKGALPGEKGWDLSKKSYQVKYRKWERAKERQRELQGPINRQQRNIARLEESILNW